MFSMAPLAAVRVLNGALYIGSHGQSTLRDVTVAVRWRLVAVLRRQIARIKCMQNIYGFFQKPTIGLQGQNAPGILAQSAIVIAGRRPRSRYCWSVAER